MRRPVAGGRSGDRRRLTRGVYFRAGSRSQEAPEAAERAPRMDAGQAGRRVRAAAEHGPAPPARVPAAGGVPAQPPEVRADRRRGAAHRQAAPRARRPPRAHRPHLPRRLHGYVGRPIVGAPRGGSGIWYVALLRDTSVLKSPKWLFWYATCGENWDLTVNNSFYAALWSPDAFDTRCHPEEYQHCLQTNK